MGEGEYEPTEVSKKGRTRKKSLYNSILKLMEFYFSDSNLAKDRFMSQKLNDGPYVDLDVFLKFNKIRKLNCSLDDIQKAISKSDLIELSEDGEKVKRKLPVKINKNVDNCTIYVENIKADADHEWVSQMFSEFGKVVYVSIPKYKHNKTIKGFAFVEFEDEEGAKNTLDYFEKIDCKMPSDTNAECLRSIKTFQEEEADPGQAQDDPVKNEFEQTEPIQESTKEETTETENKSREEAIQTETSTKRKFDSDEGAANKKAKIEDSESNLNTQTQTMEVEDPETKKKKKHKKDKKKNIIKELGLQVLSKPEWKKIRNRYLDLQRKKMKEFKQYLHRQKFANKNNDKIKPEEPVPKLDFVPGVIVKIQLTEPVVDVKKIKNDIKALSADIKYVDIPPVGSEEIFIRFSNSTSAKEFCSKEAVGQKTVLQDDEEQMYWQKIQNDRGIKFSKNVSKQRGRDKLLKKAEKERAKHIKFDEAE